MSLVESDLDAGSGVATLRFNRPDVLNALDVPTARAFRNAALPLADDPRVRCIVLRGNGRAFVAGGDLSAFAADFTLAAAVVDDLLDALHPVIEMLSAHDAPVIAAVQGAVAGAGLSLMSACDLVVAAEGTRFLLAYDRIGAAPDCGGTYFLPRVVGMRRAAELMLLGSSWSVGDALAAGLISRVVAADALDTEVDRLSRQIAAGPTGAFGAYKRLASEAFARPLDEHLEAERAAFRQATCTSDFREGVSAFLLKQPPRFTGR